MVITNSQIDGSVRSVGSTGLTICGSKIAGALSVASATGPVSIASIFYPFFLAGGTLPFGSNTIYGPVTLASNTGGYGLDQNTIYGTVTVANNKSAEGTSGQASVADNYIDAPLSCSGNVPCAIAQSAVWRSQPQRRRGSR